MVVNEAEPAAADNLPHADPMMHLFGQAIAAMLAYGMCTAIGSHMLGVFTRLPEGPYFLVDLVPAQALICHGFPPGRALRHMGLAVPTP